MLNSKSRPLSLSCTFHLAEVNVVQQNDNGQLSYIIFSEYHHPTAVKLQGCSEQHSVLGNIVMATKQMGHPTPAHSHCSTVCERNTARARMCLWASARLSQASLSICFGHGTSWGSTGPVCLPRDMHVHRSMTSAGGQRLRSKSNSQETVMISSSPVYY